MSAYERRVRLTLTKAEADILATAINIGLTEMYDQDAVFSGRDIAALQRADAKLTEARAIAAQRNAAKKSAPRDGAS